MKSNLEDAITRLAIFEDMHEAKQLLGAYLERIVGNMVISQGQKPLSVFFQDLVGIYKSIKNSAVDFENQINQITTSGITDPNFLGTSLKTLITNLDEIDEIHSGNMELLNENLNFLAEKFEELGAFIKGRFNEKEFEDNDFKILTIPYHKYYDLMQTSASAKITLKNTNSSLSRLEKQYQNTLEENISLKELMAHLEEQNHTLIDKTKGQEHQSNPDQSNEILSLREEISKLQSGIAQRDHSIRELQNGLKKYNEQIIIIKQKNTEKSSEIESNLKQEKLSHEQTKKDLELLEEKYKETSEYLKKEVIKSNEFMREGNSSSKRVQELNEILQRKDTQIHQLTLDLKENTDKLHALQARRTPKSISRFQSVEEGCVTPERNMIKTPEVGLSPFSVKLDAQERQQSDIENEDDLDCDVLELRQKIENLTFNLAQKEHEAEDSQRLKEDLVIDLEKARDEIISLKRKNNVLKEKRANGIKEIEKLRVKLDDLKTQYSVNQSLNTSFSMEALDSKDFTLNGDSDMAREVLNLVYSDIQSLYKDIVLLLPLDDNDKNMSLISIERKTNGLINLLCESLE